VDKKLVLIVLLVFLVAIGAVANFTYKSEDKDSVRKQITVTDLKGREVSVEAPVDNVVVTYSLGDLLAVGGEDLFDKIVGWAQYWKRFSPSFWDKYTTAFPELENVHNVGYRETVDVEHVVSLNPDIVITSKSHYETYNDIYQKISQGGVPVVTLNYGLENMDARRKSTMLLGKILGKEEKAEEVWNFCKDQYDRVFNRLQEIDKAKPKVYVETRFKGYGEPGYYTYGDIGWGAIVDHCGGINIAENKGRHPQVSREFVLNENPEVFIVEGVVWPEALGYNAGSEEQTLENIRGTYFNRPGWKNLKAWKNERYYAIHHEFFRHTYDFVGYQLIAKANYPQEFENLNPEESWKEFHEKFLPVDYSGNWTVTPD